jgi:hypothetical protein
MNGVTRVLNRTIYQSRRRTDRYIRMFHRAAADEIKQHWFDLAVEHDRKAAHAARRLAEEINRSRT